MIMAFGENYTPSYEEEEVVTNPEWGEDKDTGNKDVDKINEPSSTIDMWWKLLDVASDESVYWFFSENGFAMLQSERSANSVVDYINARYEWSDIAVSDLQERYVSYVNHEIDSIKLPDSIAADKLSSLPVSGGQLIQMLSGLRFLCGDGVLNDTSLHDWSGAGEVLSTYLAKVSGVDVYGRVSDDSSGVTPLTWWIYKQAVAYQTDNDLPRNVLSGIKDYFSYYERNSQ